MKPFRLVGKVHEVTRHRNGVGGIGFYVVTFTGAAGSGVDGRQFIISRYEPGDEVGKVQKRVTLTLVGLDGNAYALLGAFSKQARKEGWTSAEVSAVIKRATSGSYDNLLSVLLDHTIDGGGEDE
jgi:hypothetical protein